MRIACLAFTEKGFALARRLANALEGTADRSGQPLNLQQWTAAHFSQEQALLYVGAVGIAVRAIAPYLQSKVTDPAVVVVDEGGQFAIPLLSGHLGGANDLARRVSKLCGAMPVITTATDVNHVFAVDEWARHQRCTVVQTQRIRHVSGTLLAGKPVRVKTEIPVDGIPPAGINLTETAPWDVYVGVAPQPDTVLWLVPQTVVLGVGCRRGISAQALEALLPTLNIPIASIRAVATIDLKAEEEGLLTFCNNHNWPMLTYRAEELALAKGDYTHSDFVQRITGVDNVCERAAVLGSGGFLIRRKLAAGGVTLAAASRPYQLNWSFHNEW